MNKDLKTWKMTAMHCDPILVRKFLHCFHPDLSISLCNGNYNGNPLQPTSSTVNPCSLAASVQKQPLALTAFSSSPLCVSVVLLHHHLLLLLHHHHLHSFHPVRVYGNEVLSKSGLLYNDSFFCPSVHKHRIKQQGT